MKFFIDFEANTGSEKIISIGATAQNGSVFSCLINPNEKIDPFITSLTGITQEQIDTMGLPAEVAFSHLRTFVFNECEGGLPEYYCYGKMDKHFIEKSMSDVEDVSVLMFMRDMRHTLIDYAVQVKNMMNAKSSISLRKAFILCKEEEVVQSHNALEDALMLQFVVDTFPTKIEEGITMADAAKIAEEKKKKRAPDIFYQWPGAKGDMWSAETGADETNYGIKMWAGKRVMYFTDKKQAALWIIKYIAKGRSPKKDGDIYAVCNNIKKAIANNRQVYCFNWEVNPNV